MLKLHIIIIAIVITLTACDDKKPEVSAKDHLDLSKLYFSHGAFKASMIEGKNALKLEPNNPTTLAAIANTLLKLNDINSANHLIDRAISLTPDNEDIKLIKIKILLLQRNATLTKELFESIKNENTKKRPEYINLYADLKLLLKQPNKAKEWYLKTLKLNNKDITALLGAAKASLVLKQTDEVEKYTSLAIKSSPNNISALIWKTQIHMLKKQYKKAEDTISKAMIELEQHDTLTIKKYKAFDLLAKALMAQGKIEESFKYSNYLAKTQAGKIQASYKHALSLLSDEKDFNNAEEAFENLLTQAPTHTYSGTILGLIKYKKSNYELADEYLSKFSNDENTPLRNKKILIHTKIKLNKYDDAITIASKALKQHKNDDELHALLGHSYFKQNKLRKSISELKTAISLSPLNESYHANLSQAYLKNNELNLAKISAQKALQISPNSSQGQTAIIKYFLTTKQYKLAGKKINQWRIQEPNSIVALHLSAIFMEETKQPDKANIFYKKIISTEPFNLAANFNLIKDDLSKNKLTAAFKKLHTLIDNNPEDMATLSLLHNISEKTNTTKKAEALLLSIIEKHQDTINSRLLLAQFNIKNNKTNAAIAFIDKVITLDKNNVNDYLLKAKSLLMLNNINGAIETYLSLVQSNPVNPIGFTQLSRVAYQNKNFKQSYEYAKKAIAINDDYIPAYISLGLAAIGANNKESATKAILAIRKRSPKSYISYEMHGDLFYKLNKNNDAIEYYKKAWSKKKSVALANKFKDIYTKQLNKRLILSAWDELAQINRKDLKIQLTFSSLLQKEGETVKAQQVLESQLKHHSNNAALLNNLANLYLELNDKRSLVLAKKAFSLDSGNPAIQDTLGWVYAKQFKDYKKAIPLLKQAYKLSNNHQIKTHLVYALTKSGKTQEINLLN